MQIVWYLARYHDIKISNAPILGSILGIENTYGALEGRTPASPLTYGRITTDDTAGVIRTYVGEGELTNDELGHVGTIHKTLPLNMPNGENGCVGTGTAVLNGK